jgi:hypothetical protein
LAFTSLVSRIGSPAENGARDRPGELVDRVGALVLADEIRTDRGGGPGLPAQLLRRDLGAEADVGGGDQHVGGFELGDGRRGGRRRRIRATGQQRSDAAGDDGDDEHNDTRGCHTLTSHKITLRLDPCRYSAGSLRNCHTTARPVRGRACAISAGKRQSMVNEAYLNRVNSW